MDAAAVKLLIKEQLEIKEKQHAAEISKLKEELDGSNLWARNVKIKQETAKFDDEGDKTAVTYLLNEKFDMESLQKVLMEKFGRTNDEGESVVDIKVSEENMKDAEDFIMRTFRYLSKRDRINRMEIENYNMANVSHAKLR